MKLESLLTLPAEKRATDFRDTLYRALLESDTPFAATDTYEGPDGFRYLGLAPSHASTTDTPSASFRQWTKVGLEQGSGIALFPNIAFTGTPTWVFSFGCLWPLEQYGCLGIDPLDEIGFESDNAEAPEHIEPEREVTIARPDSVFFPELAREAMSADFNKHGFKNVAVVMVTDPTSAPSRNLAFSYSEDDFPTPEALEKFVHIAQWHLPLSRAFILRPEDANWNFEPLSRLQLN